MTAEPLVYLFLDFDGVVHPLFAGSSHHPWEHKPFCYLESLENAIRRIRQPVRIVIASTWRKPRELEQLRAPFAADIRPLVVGKTPAIGSGNTPGSRLVEVQAWMAQHAHSHDRAVAIDDVPELYLGPNGETDQIALVCCPDRFGSQQAQALTQACLNPDSWIQTHPIEQRRGLVIVRAGMN